MDKKVYLNNALNWILGIIFGLIGITTIFSEPIPGLVLIFMAAVLLPPVSNLINKKWKLQFSKKVKIAFIVVGILIYGFTVDTTTTTQSNKIKNQPREIQQNQNSSPKDTGEEELITDNINSSITENREKGTEIFSPSTSESEQLGDKYYSVIKVVDGDTIDIDLNGTIERLRLIGMDTPETVDPRKTVECFGREASGKAKEILENQKVKIESDLTQGERDKYGRLLFYVYLEDGLFFNKWMIENGYAHEYTYAIPYKYQAEFQEAESYARENQLGLWGPDTCNGITKNTNAQQTEQIIPTQEMNDSEQELEQQTTGHIFYTSSHYSAKFYYCDTDSVWEGLSPKYLEIYTNEAELLEKYPTKTLHELCI